MSAVRVAETALRDAIAHIGQGEVGRQLDVSPSRMSELMKEDLVNRCAKLLVACGFRLVSSSEPTYPPGHVAAMEVLAKLYMADIGKVPR